ncbi:MAG: hypothetical protein K0R18_219 [Bacillales bacterium]|jgi:hypothetical protein|nr:hypothetical protein [Bacillales bacterium]
MSKKIKFVGFKSDVNGESLKLSLYQYNEDVKFLNLKEGEEITISDSEFNLLPQKLFTSGKLVLIEDENFSSLNDEIDLVNLKLDGTINVKEFGAKADYYGARTDDTQAFRDALYYAIMNKKVLRIPNGEYYITDNILTDEAQAALISRLYGRLVIEGDSVANTIIMFRPTNVNTPFIGVKKTSEAYISNIFIAGDANKKGIGLELGEFVANPLNYGEIARSVFRSIRTYGLNIGIDHKSGWCNDFYNCITNNCNTGTRVVGNILNFYGHVSELNNIGVDIGLDESTAQHSSINFYGATVEANNGFDGNTPGIGFKVRQCTDLNLFGIYMELNKLAHIHAGTDAGDKIESLNIYGGSWHYNNPLIFDRVDNLTVKGTGMMGIYSIKVTENVKVADIQPIYQNHLNTGSGSFDWIEVVGKNTQSNVPWYQNNLSKINIPTPIVATPVNLDTNGYLKIQGLKNGTLSEHADVITGTKAIKYTAAAGDTFAGIYMTLLPEKLPPSDFLSLKLISYLSSTATAFRRQIIVRYKDLGDVLKGYTTFDHNSAYDVAVSKIIDKYTQYITPINLDVVKKLPDFASIYDIQINIQIVTTPAANGTEWFAIDSLEIYPTKYIANNFNNLPFQSLYSPSTISSPEILNIGDGTAIKKHIGAAVTFDAPSIAANSLVEVTVTVTGVALGDTIVATPGTSLSAEASLIWSAYVSAADTVRIRLANISGSAIDPINRTWRIDAWRH